MSPQPPRPVAAQPVELTRRTFLAGAGTAALAGFTLPSIFPRYAFAGPGDPGADVLVVVFLRGGADGLSMVVPYSDEEGYQHLRGGGGNPDIPSVAVAPPDPGDPASCLDISGTHPSTLGGHEFGFHPAMAGTGGGLKAVWDAGHLAVVHATGMGLYDPGNPSRSHFDAQDHWGRATNAPSVATGWLARHLGAADPDHIPGLAWGINVQAALRGHPSVASAASIAGIGVTGYSDPEAVTTALEGLYPEGAADPLVAQGHGTLKVLELVDQADPLSYANGTTYPDSSLAAGLRQIAMMVRAPLGVRVACIDSGAWDLHGPMGGPGEADGAMRGLVLGLADALQAFHTDLVSDGSIGNVTVMVVSEFGRTITVNASGGTDHGRGNAMFLMGGNVVPGLHGDYPSGPLEQSADGDLAVTTDMRTVITELLQKRMGGADLGTVLPGFSSPGDLGVFSS